MKSAIQRKAAEKPLGNSPKARNQRTLPSQWGEKGEKGARVLSAGGKGLCRT